MRVLIYSAAHFSDNTLPLYRAMQSLGVDVTLLIELTRPKVNLFNEDELRKHVGIFKATEYASFRRYETYCDLSNVYVENAPGIRQRNIKMLRSTRNVEKFIEEGGFDVIHTDILLMLWKTPLLKYHKIITLIQHEAIPHARKTDLTTRIFRKINYGLIPRIVILNPFVYEDFCTKFKIDKERVLINKLGPLDCITVFAKDSVHVNTKRLVFWGRIVSYKGLEYLCKAMISVHKSVPDAELIIAGGGDFYFDIEPYKQLPFIKIIHRYLDMDELATLIASCAFTVCPYVSSSQSGGVITSLVMGKPVVGTDIKAMHEMIVEGETGLLVPPRNDQALADAIVHLLTDERLQKKMSSCIEKNNSEDQSWLQIALKYIDFYQRKIK